MRQKYTPDMMMEEVAIAFTTGRCPRCDQALQVRADPDEITFTCPGCTWQSGGSRQFYEMLQEVIGC